MMTVQDYKELRVWQRAIDLVTAVYSATQSFPDQEMYGLKSQLRRAAVSVPSNIAEGQGRASTGEFRHFLGIARGSLHEIETQIHIAGRLRFLTPSQAKDISQTWREVIRMLNALMNSLPRN
jgi:four helix bundle protein